jgi:hypothetical protein
MAPDKAPGLLNWARSKRLIVPEFQREFLWANKPDKTAALLASVAQGWPAGALLLMEGNRGFHSTPVHRWKKDSKIPISSDDQLSLLDGQQRITALYQALYNRSERYVFAVAILELLNSGDVDADEGGTFRSFGRKTWERRYGDFEKQRGAGLIAVSDLINPKAWDLWKDEFDQAEKGELSELRESGALSGLLNYTFPVSTIQANAPDEALANIFVTINEQGIKLTTFDLVVAKSIKRKRGRERGFNLRDTWYRAAGREETEDEPAIPPAHDRIRTFGLSPEVPLKLLRLITDRTAKLSNASLLNLEPTDVRTRIDNTLKALDDTLAFLERELGLIPQTLPDPNYLLPLALVAHTKPAALKNIGDKEKLCQWFWAASFLTVFGKGQTGDFIPQEAADLEDWVVQHGSTPRTVDNFWRELDLKRLFQGTAQNKHFLQALLALEVAEGARDWRGTPDGEGRFEQFPLREAGTWPLTALDVHHMFARGIKKPPKTAKKVRGLEIPHGDQAYESIVNRCLLLKETNIAIGNSAFRSVSDIKGITKAAMGTYLLDPSAEDWHRFVKRRVDMIVKALKVRVPED